MRRSLVLLISFLAWTAVAAEPSAPGSGKAAREVAGKAEFLRLLPKPFAVLKSVNLRDRTVTLLLEGEKVAKVWAIEPDAELKVAGWWGRLEQFRPGDRVWAWLKLDRQKNPVSVVMLADEPSEQDIHDIAWKLAAVEEPTWLSAVKKGPTLVLRAGKSERKVSLPANTRPPAVQPGQRVYVQTTEGGRLRVLWTEKEFAQARAAQKAWLRKRWTEDGLPGTLTFLHVFSGELELTLDHEAMRWARALQTGDVVHLAAEPPIKGVVRSVAPWRERTVVRLVVGELESSELRIGQRLALKRTPLPEAVDDALYPPDLDRKRSSAERVEWFLASTYCSCAVAGDVCTGHFYTLASCNPNGCAMPRHMRGVVSKKIERGLTDRQIFDELVKEFGPDALRPHLAP
jgi:hypothetical protein